MTKRPAPRRIAEHSGHSIQQLLADAAAYEPPAGAREEVWQRLAAEHATLADGADDLAAIVASARTAVEPPPGAQLRIWRRLEEEALARAGVAEPVRLQESDEELAPLLRAAGAFEPPAGRRTRLLLALEPRRPASRRFAVPAFAGLAAAAVAAAFVAFDSEHDPMTPGAEEAPVAVATGTIPVPAVEPLPTMPADPAPALRAGDTFAAGRGDRRLRVPTMGDMVLGQAQVRVARADAEGLRLELTGGRLALHADKRPKESPLVIAVADVEVRVVGTVFTVDATHRAGVSVVVGEGIVEVRRGRETVRVTAGQVWSSPGLRAEPTDEGGQRWAARSMRIVAAGVPLTMPSPPSLAGQVMRTPPPAEMEPSIATPLALPSLAPTPVVAPAPATPAEAWDLPPIAANEPEPTPPPATGRLDVNTEAMKYRNVSAAMLRARAADARLKQDRRREAVLLRALVDAKDASPLDALVALRSLGELFDEQLGQPLEAVAVRRELAQRSGSARPDARFQIALTLAELGHPDALEAVNDCLMQCSEDARVHARLLRVRELQLAGELRRASIALDQVRRAGDDKASSRLAETFFLRARFHLQNGQGERARGAASLVRAFDSAGVFGSQLRQLNL